MRIIVFSDVQGNSVALETMLANVITLPEFEASLLICLGDVACGYAPNQVLDLLRQYDVQCIRGNMDDVLLNPPQYAGDDEDEQRYNVMDTWASLKLSSHNRSYLQNTVPNLTQSHQGINYFFAHGSPHDYDMPLNYDMQESDLLRYIPDRVDVLFTGHTHGQFLVPVADKTLVNPGSIGFPDPLSDGKRPLRAQFAIIEDGHTSFYSLHYDAEKFIESVRATGMPHAEWYLSQWQLTPD